MLNENTINDRISEDLEDMKKKLNLYADKGRIIESDKVRTEPIIAVKPDKSKIKPLKKIESYDGRFLAVDCSTRTLKRANNWGIYLLRTVYALVKEHNVDWGYEETIRTTIGNVRTRHLFLEDVRRELESEMACNVVRKLASGDYILLDGSAFFGGYQKFRVSLYEKCEKEEIRLITVSKRSPMLCDERGRDFVAATHLLSADPMWIYHPIRKANKDEHLYGDVCVAKLCDVSPRIFRCDIMEYLLVHYEPQELLSPLTFLAEDPRCLGYIVPLWLAHDFSAPSNSKLLEYHDRVEETLAIAGLLDVVRIEELSYNFPDELHGIKRAYERELWSDYV
jgi:hypothetical protein